MYIRVSVRTDAGVEFVKKESGDSYLIAVKAPPERGLANTRVAELLREHLGGGGKRLIIRIVSGHHSPHKLISIEDGE
jgi:uncharacterized protein YggU (UPF0235/DUF167 family)